MGEELDEIRSLAASVADERIAQYAAVVDDEARFPTEGYQALVESQLHAPVIPETYGGVGADALTCAVIAEEIARVCATTQQVSGGNELFSWPLLLGGTAEQHERWLRPIAEGRALGAFALSEPEAGSDIVSMSTRATRVDEGWRIKGTKRWITNGGVADVYVLFAVSDPDARSRGISAFVIERGDAGLTFGTPERKMGLKGSPTTEVYLDNVIVPEDRLIGEPGQGIQLALGTLDRTRTGVAAQAVGIAQGALDVATQYVKQRTQFGQRIADFQGIQFMLADMAVAIRAARLLTHAAAVEIEEEAPTMGASGAAAKLFASDTAMRVTTDAVQLLGGAGYVKDYPVERMMRDAKITQIYEGTNQIQRIVIARDLLSR
ncbi:MAG: acyl-CoA dehydrogenase [Intrasporangiaceae bacterium]|nr:acyl-CoA dehydrogenase [Intrasporangiaceae bacterium]